MGRRNRMPSAIEYDPGWYKRAVIYQLHVRSFVDSDANGIGDFTGLTQKLDYLQDLGVTAVWLLPFYPSPLRDDGYDIADYYSINPTYGSLADFKNFLAEAHRRGLRVITELVINHTSDQHPWFQRSRRAKAGSAWRNFYVWSDTPEKYKDARIIFKDFETSNWSWDPVARAYFWHRFYSHQPDLNFENPQVHEEIFKMLDFWLGLGVDGLRLDAIPYLYEQEGTSCENLPQTHEFLKKLRKRVDDHYGDRMLLAEANQWPEDAVAYFGTGKGDECHMSFHFPLMPRLFMAVRLEDRVPIVDILEQTPPVPETSQWAVFLRNHDELTLEMVTDEERDYMYRVYAHDLSARINLGIRRRLGPLLGHDRKKIELLHGLLFSLPGTPVIYYGDEIGMGDNIFLGDRNGVRTPMQWSSDRNAGFSRANPQRLYLPIIVDPEYHYEAVNVEAQQQNPHSLLWWMKRMLALRKQSQAFGMGTMEFLQPENRKILAYLRRYQDELVLIVANLSRFVQPVELDLSAFQGRVPVEILGRTEFPPIGSGAYFMTLSPHAFFWFALENRAAATQQIATPELRLSVAEEWTEILEGKPRRELERALPDYLRPRRWFGSKAKTIKTALIADVLPISTELTDGVLGMVEVDYVQDEPEQYLLPLAFATGAEADRLRAESPQLIIGAVELKNRNVTGVLFDAAGSKAFGRVLLEGIARRRTFRGQHGQLVFQHTAAFRDIRGETSTSSIEPAPLRVEQSNSAISFGDKFILKLFRKLEAGTNPDLEIGRRLTAREFPHVPLLGGAIEYRRGDGETISLAVLHQLIPNVKDAWTFTIEALMRFYERVHTLPAEQHKLPRTPGRLAELVDLPISLEISTLIGSYLDSSLRLGERTAGLHLALAAEVDDKSFAPEPFNPHFQRSLYQSMRNLAVQNFGLLRKRLKTIPEEVRPIAERVAQLEPEVLRRFRSVYEHRIHSMRIRTHGDFHLGQVLSTGKDFFIIDFEGEPARALSQRRIKRSPLSDVAGMLRSFHYASYAALHKQREIGNLTPEKVSAMQPWAEFWYFWVGVSFLKSYLPPLVQNGLLPENREEVVILLEAYLLEKAIYELGYELNNRPDWVRIPLHGIIRLMGGVP